MRTKGKHHFTQRSVLSNFPAQSGWMHRIKKQRQREGKTPGNKLKKKRLLLAAPVEQLLCDRVERGVLEDALDVPDLQDEDGLRGPLPLASELSVYALTVSRPHSVPTSLFAGGCHHVSCKTGRQPTESRSSCRASRHVTTSMFPPCLLKQSRNGGVASACAGLHNLRRPAVSPPLATVDEEVASIKQGEQVGRDCNPPRGLLR